MTKDELVKVVQASAESLHDAGCDITVTIGFCGALGITVSGAWSPDALMVMMLLESVLRSMQSGEASIIDLTKRSPSD